MEPSFTTCENWGEGVCATRKDVCAASGGRRRMLGTQENITN